MNRICRIRSAFTWTVASILLSIASVGTSAAAEGFNDNNDGYNQCVIQAMRGTRSVTAVQIMQNACQKLWFEAAMMRDADKRYYVCLLQSLPGVENDYGAQVVAAACGRQAGR
jgi:hypothetical protein